MEYDKTFESAKVWREWWLAKCGDILSLEKQQVWKAERNWHVVQKIARKLADVAPEFKKSGNGAKPIKARVVELSYQLLNKEGMKVKRTEQMMCLSV